MLKIEHLRKRFGNLVVLDDVNLTLEKGEVISVIGQSGMGKSVILKHVIGLLVPDGGQVVLDGEVVSSPTMTERDFSKVRRRFGYLFQGAALFDSMTVGENMAFPLREHTKHTDKEIADLIAEALQMVGLQAIQDKMPSELSGGMRSRVGLARAIVMKPEIMLYDEPTSALDPIMSDKINDLILELKQKLNMTSIVVTHDMNSAYKISDKIAMLNEGKIIFEGTPAEIRASRNPYIQQFISGRRKLHYAVSAQQHEREVFNQQVDISRLNRKADAIASLRRSRQNPQADAITGLDNKHSYAHGLEAACTDWQQNQIPFAAALVSVDKFGQLVQEHGGPFGEVVLQGLAAVIRSCLRGASDLTARYSNDTFALLAHIPDESATQALMERIRDSVVEDNFETPDGKVVPVTVSVGAVLCDRSERCNADTLLVLALESLDAAHKRGTNRIAIQGVPGVD